jgi:hypothetical protein
MAKMTNINIGTETISVPAWATEDTLSLIAENLKKNDTVSRRILASAARIGATNDTDLANVLDNLTGELKSLAQKERAEFEANTKRFTASVKQVASHFGDTKKPLTSMASAAGDLAGGAGNLLGKLSKDGKIFSGISDTAASNIGAITEGAGAVVGTLLGWNAGKIEQFAEVQQQMIASGAVTFDGLYEPFNDLYRRSMESGITYTQFSNVVAQQGALMASMGKSVGAGSQRFMELIEGDKGILKVADQFGDLGMTSEAMINEYAQYLDSRRRAGEIRRGAEVNRDALNKGFIKLNMESNAYAALLGMNADDARAAMTSAMDDNKFAAASTLKRQTPGFKEEVKNAEAFKQAFAVVGKAASLPDEMQSLILDAFVTEYYTSGTMGRAFDIEGMKTALAGKNPEMKAALEKIPFFESVQDILSGQIEAGPSLLKALTSDKVTEAAVNFQRNTQNAAGEYAHALSKSKTELDNRMGEVTDYGAAWTAAVDDATKNMKAAGETSVAMNNASKVMLALQEKITVDLQDASIMVGKFTKWLNDSIENGEYDPDRIEDKLTPEIIERLRTTAPEDLSDADNELLNDMLISIQKEERAKMLQWIEDSKDATVERAFEENDSAIMAILSSALPWLVGTTVSGVTYGTGELADLIQDTTNSGTWFNGTEDNSGILDRFFELQNNDSGESNDEPQTSGNNKPTPAQIELTKELVKLQTMLAESEATESDNLTDLFLNKQLKIRIEEIENELSNLEKRASGGPVKRGIPYIVGDGLDGNMRYAELFMPNVDGQIFTASETKDILNADSIEAQNRFILAIANNISSLETSFKAFQRPSRDAKVAGLEQKIIDSLDQRIESIDSKVSGKIKPKVDVAFNAGIQINPLVSSEEETLDGFTPRQISKKRTIERKSYEITNRESNKNTNENKEMIEKSLQSQQDLLKLLSKLRMVVEFFERDARTLRASTDLD